jgi:hypothetical protein
VLKKSVFEMEGLEAFDKCRQRYYITLGTGERDQERIDAAWDEMSTAYLALSEEHKALRTLPSRCYRGAGCRWCLAVAIARAEEASKRL